MTTECLDDNTLLDLDALGPEEMQHVAAHIDECELCCALVGEALQGNQSATNVQTGTEESENVIGRYRLLEVLGSGGSAIVYRAYDPKLTREVALKRISFAAAGARDERERKRFVREAQLMARLSHPNTVRVFDVEELEDGCAIAMEFVEGTTLSKWLQAKQRSLQDILSVFVAAGRGLVAAHDAGLIHRDFKPANVLVDEEGGARVGDFGLASAGAFQADIAIGAGRAPCEDELELTLTGSTMGTPAYMAPEQHAGEKLDARADQYSFCLSLYEGIYGERPFDGQKASEICLQKRKGLTSKPKSSDVPEHGVAGVVMALFVWSQQGNDAKDSCERSGDRLRVTWNAEKEQAITKAFHRVAPQLAAPGSAIDRRAQSLFRSLAEPTRGGLPRDLCRRIPERA
jgi:serine/threonine protein kinase